MTYFIKVLMTIFIITSFHTKSVYSQSVDLKGPKIVGKKKATKSLKSKIDQSYKNKQKIIQEEKEEEINNSDSKTNKAKTNHSFGLGIGQTFLVGPYSNFGEDKITVDLFYFYKASHTFEVMVNAHMSSHNLGDQEISIMGSSVSIKTYLLHIDSFSPYALAGLGFYLPQTRELVAGEIIDSESKLTFGSNFGGGMDLSLNESFTLGLLCQYHNPFDVKQETVSKIEGSYLKLLITFEYIY